MTDIIKLFDIQSEMVSPKKEKDLTVIYKYHRTGEHLNQLIETNSLHLTHQNKLNDVFECRYQLSERYMSTLIERAAFKMRESITTKYPTSPYAKLTEEDWKIMTRMITEDPHWREVLYRDILYRDMGWGICSFTEDHSNDVMWGNYADCFKGVCLEFDFRKSPLEEKLSAVIYDDELVIIDDNIMDGWHQAALTKKKNWSYEREWRSLYFPGEGKMPFDKKQLTGIYFGVNCDKKERESIMDLCQRNDYTVNFQMMANNVLDNRISFVSYDPKAPSPFLLPEHTKKSV